MPAYHAFPDQYKFLSKIAPLYSRMDWQDIRLDYAKKLSHACATKSIAVDDCLTAVNELNIIG